ncbi:hypothetical protein CGJ97_17605 [Vibrio parahaemolyticus]|nr:YkgJ family cysteine cluster protein [Vibrio parahaemolyticus]TOB92199.1 hypothetical protein CGJ97_17605 [Vibrio parahaemolyticus]
MFSKLFKAGYWTCCIAPSISSPIPGMPKGKPAGVRCVQLNDDNLCKLFGKPERPNVCHDFKPCPVVCGKTNQEALDNITELEQLT